MAENQHDGGNDILLPADLPSLAEAGFAKADVDSANGVAAFTVEVQVVAADLPSPIEADFAKAGVIASELVDLRGEIANPPVVELGGAHIPFPLEGNDAPHPTLPLEGGGKGGGDGSDVVALDPDSVLHQAGGEVLTITGDPSRTVALQGTWHLDYKGGGDGFSMYTGTTSDAQHPYVTLFVHTVLHVDENGAILI